MTPEEWEDARMNDYDYDTVWDAKADALIRRASTILAEHRDLTHDEEEIVLDAALVITCRRENLK